MSVNRERGELTLTLDGRAYPMLPSHASIIAIEEQVGSVVALTGRLADQSKRLSVYELSIIVTETVRAAGRDRGDKMLESLRREKIAELIVEEGIVSVMQPLQTLLINMITGGSKVKKKPSADGKKQK